MSTRPEVPTQAFSILAPWGASCFFKTRPECSFGKIHQIYCDRENYFAEDVDLYFNGDKVLFTDTPASLGMQQNDVVDALCRIQKGRKMSPIK